MAAAVSRNSRTTSCVVCCDLQGLWFILWILNLLIYLLRSCLIQKVAKERQRKLKLQKTWKYLVLLFKQYWLYFNQCKSTVSSSDSEKNVLKENQSLSTLANYILDKFLKDIGLKNHWLLSPWGCHYITLRPTTHSTAYCVQEGNKTECIGSEATGNGGDCGRLYTLCPVFRRWPLHKAAIRLQPIIFLLRKDV